MKVQELINLLNTLPDKTTEVVIEYDGRYYPIKACNNKPLYSDDGGINIEGYKEPNAELYNAITLTYW